MLAAFVFWTTASLKAQDTIRLISGEGISGKVLEMAGSYILYHPAGAPDSVQIMRGTGDLKTILFQNGVTEIIPHDSAELRKYTIKTFEREYVYRELHADRKYLYKLMVRPDIPEINQYIREAKKYKTATMIFGFAGIPLFYSIIAGGSMLENQVNNPNFAPVLFLTAALSVSAVEATAIVMNVMHKLKFRKAVNRYNTYVLN